jgi:carbon monoxide dehydrogenase subunit G
MEERMATLHKEISIDARPEQVWDAVRDIGALHTRLVPGFVVDTRVEGDARVVTFGNGMVVREPILSCDDERRRLAWSAEGGHTTHYNAVLQVSPEGGGSRVRWTTDLLPHAMADAIGAMQDQGLAAMKRTLEQRGS